MTGKKYKIKLHRKVIEDDSTNFNAKTKEKIKNKCIELLSIAPDTVGESLRFELSGYRKLKIFNNYRVVYKVHKQEVVVFVLAVGIRRDKEVYEKAISRIL